MYVTLRGAPETQPSGTGRRSRVPATVVLLGVVSMLTDVSSEAVAAILPLYLTAVVGLSPLAYGFVDGVYQGVSTVVRMAGGMLADRGDRPKWVAFAGYGVSAITRLALLPAQGFAAVTAVVAADRLGKGLRTAPRDALIAAATEPPALGRAFGVHRAMDTAGALAGPLIAFAVLLAVPLGFDVVFVVSFAFALAGLVVLGLLVPDMRPRRARADAATADAGEAARPSWRLLGDRRLRRLLVVAGGLGVLTIGDGFLYLALQRRDDLATELFPLLFVGTSAVYMALAVPMGRLADRIGRARVFVLGHVALLGAYVCASGPLGGPAATVACLALLGTFYATTDGVLAALAARAVPTSVRASGIAAAQTVVAGARFVASVMFGLAWTLTSRDTAIILLAAALALALPVALRAVRGLDSQQVGAAA